MEVTAASAQHQDETSTPAADPMEGVETVPRAAQSHETEKEAVASKDLTASSVSSHLAPTSETPAPAHVPTHEPTTEPAQPVSTMVSQQQQAQPPANMQETTLVEPPSHSQSPRAHLHPIPLPNATPTPLASLASTPPPAQATQIRRPHQEANGVMIRFASPDNDHQTRVPRFKRDLSLVADAVQQSCPEAVRRIVRDKWEKCIMGSDFHHAFILNATIHHANGIIMRRAVRDFGNNLVTEAKAEIAAHLTTQDIDAISGALLDKCSDEFLDRALERRLKTIDARSLINALARAERLGYENSDVLEDQQEDVVPVVQREVPAPALKSTLNFGSDPASTQYISPQPAPVPPLYQPPEAYPQAPPVDLQCKQCWRKFTETAPYEYHVKKQLCLQQPAENMSNITCDHCGANFTTKMGKQYHQANAVCGAHAMARPTPKSRPPPVAEWPPTQTTSQLPIHSNSFLPPSSQLPSQPSSTPRSSRIERTSTPGSQDDPYAHLNPEQRASLEDELRQAELSHAPRFREAEALEDPFQREIRIGSLQNSFSTKQSIIRRKYGVRLRKRRTQQEIDSERVRMGIKHGLAGSPDPTSETANKRRRSDDGADIYGRNSPTAGRVLQSHTPIPPPTNHLTVSEMGSGLDGSLATAATTDPTNSQLRTQSPSSEQQASRTSLSSLQRKGYRVSSHVAKPSQPEAGTPNTHRNGSALSPLLLDDSSDGSDADEEIPATLPPTRKIS